MAYSYGSDSICRPVNSVFVRNFTCGVCASINLAQSVFIPCPQTNNANIATSMNDAVIASATAVIINEVVPAGITVAAPTGASLDGAGLFTLTVPITSSSSLSPTELQAVRDAIAASIAQQFSIIPSSRVSVILAKKRDSDVSNSAVVVIQQSSAYSLRISLFLIFNVLVFALFA
jgi:hypothetical protein